MGFTLLSESETYDEAVRRGDDYFVIYAQSDISIATPTSIQLTSPVAGLAIGPDSDFDECAARFLLPDAEAATVVRGVSIGAPLMGRIPPTGIQITPTISLVTQVNSDTTELRPVNQTLLTSGLELARLQLYVYLKPATPPQYRRARTRSSTVGVGGGVPIILNSLWAFGRKEWYLDVTVPAIVGGGTLSVTKQTNVRDTFGLFTLVTTTELANIVVPAAGESISLGGRVLGGSAIVAKFTAGVAAEVSSYIEVRD